MYASGLRADCLYTGWSTRSLRHVARIFQGKVSLAAPITASRANQGKSVAVEGTWNYGFFPFPLVQDSSGLSGGRKSDFVEKYEEIFGNSVINIRKHLERSFSRFGPSWSDMTGHKA